MATAEPAMAAPHCVEEWFQMVPHLISEEGREQHLQLRGGQEGRRAQRCGWYSGTCAAKCSSKSGMSGGSLPLMRHMMRHEPWLTSHIGTAWGPFEAGMVAIGLKSYPY